MNSFCILIGLDPKKIYTRKIKGEGEPGTEPRPPAATWPCLGGHKFYCALYRSRDAFWVATKAVLVVILKVLGKFNCSTMLLLFMAVYQPCLR